jgi:diguanylate cyclase (GGDEF)-like protein
MARRTAAAERPEETMRQATHDSQTGLPNRLLLADRLEVAVAQARRHGHLVAVVVIDLNKTTEARAALGLDAGEELTRMVSDHLKLFARKSDTLACIGSDLFAIAMPRVRDLPQILGLTSRLLQLFDGRWQFGGQVLHLAPVIGVAYHPENGDAPDELIAQAIAAANRAAKAGDQGPYLADPVWEKQARDWIALEADLRRALERDELCLFYQPQVSAASGCTSGFEALVRWRHPERGLILPGEFLPLAVETGLIKRIGGWVIEEACRQLAAWHAAGHPELRIAVNLVAEQLADEALLDLVALATDEYGIAAGQLEVEITELTAIAEQALTNQALEGLKHLGVRLTLDDFGTGYSSLRMLADYPFDTVKIDRSFVRRLCEDVKGRALIEAIVCLAHSLGMTVVAEGVETQEELALLRELGADEIQAFFISATPARPPDGRTRTPWRGRQSQPRPRPPPRVPGTAAHPRDRVSLARDPESACRTCNRRWPSQRWWFHKIDTSRATPSGLRYVPAQYALSAP